MPPVREEGDSDRDNEGGGIGRDGHKLCANGTVAHAEEDSRRKVGHAEKQIATEKGNDTQNEDLVEGSGGAIESQ